MNRAEVITQDAMVNEGQQRANGGFSSFRQQLELEHAKVLEDKERELQDAIKRAIDAEQKASGLEVRLQQADQTINAFQLTIRVQAKVLGS